MPIFLEPSCHKLTSTSESESQAEASKIFRSGELASHSGKILEWLYFLIASADGCTVMYELQKKLLTNGSNRCIIEV